MKTGINFSVDADHDKAILDHIAWLKANGRNVSAWLREMIYAGMAGKSALARQVESQGRQLDEIHRLLKSGAVVTSSGAVEIEEAPSRRVSALDKLGM